MSYILIILTTIISAIGVFYSKGGDFKQITKFGYSILALILCVGGVSLFNTYNSNIMSERISKKLEENFSAAQQQLVLQWLNPIEPFAGFRFSANMMAMYGVADEVQNLPYKMSSASPFFRKLGAGRELGTIKIDIGEDVSRRFDFKEVIDGMLVSQAIGPGELAIRSEYISRLDHCEFPNSKELCEFVYAGGIAAWREGNDVSSIGHSIDLSTNIPAASVITSIFDSGELGSIHVIDAFKEQWWWERYWIRAFYRDQIKYTLSFSQDLPGSKTGQRCSYNFSLNLKLVLSTSKSLRDLTGYFLPNGPLKVSMCSLPY